MVSLYFYRKIQLTWCEASTTGNSYFYVKIADPSTLAISIKITEDTRCVPDGKLRVRTTEPELVIFFSKNHLPTLFNNRLILNPCGLEKVV